MLGRTLATAVALSITLPGCVGALGGIDNGTYRLVRPQTVKVGNDRLQVTPPREWNRTSPRLFFDISEVEDWTQNGPLLDGITFITGLKNGKYIIRQDRSEYRQVPRYRSDMTAPEIASMLESLYRVKGGTVDFRTTGLAPRTFLGVNGFQFDFEHLDGDEVWRRGRAVGANIDGKLFMIMLDATRSHYYAASLPDYEAIVASAVRR